MVNTRSKINKIQNTINLWFSKAAMADTNHLATESGALIGCNDDLLIEILLRLPVTSVLRFKSVSKHWRSLLSNRRFTLLYKNASFSPGFFARSLYIPFDDENESIPPFRNLDFYPDPHGIRILQSCNGLLLCRSNEGDERVYKYYVFNPTTKQFAVIPSILGGMAVRKTIIFMALAFHQTDCVHYKVVCFYFPEPDDVIKVQIYSSETGKWKISDDYMSLPDYYIPPLDYIVFWNQAIHWVPFGDKSYFKLDTEEFQSLPLPVRVASSEADESMDHIMTLYFGESRGHLHLVKRVDPSESRLHLNVFEMLNDYSGWFLKYRVDLDELPDAYPEIINSYFDPLSLGYYIFDVFDVVRGEEEEETFMVIRVPGKVIRYNVVDKSFKQISDQIGQTRRKHVHRYIESLVSF
ncbi:F-box protein At5g07610 [Lactuca sativa]|uniref:F-box protein At5g07610 n=1 Tax=Lactuca sativa TaxID=4236 RepID=UPI000CB6637C|nr:F-box protein At5g07610 [Lactuca sativa]